MAPVEAKSTKVPCVCVCVCVELLFGGSITFDEDRPFPIRITSTVQSFYANKTLRATNEKKKKKQIIIKWVVQQRETINFFWPSWILVSAFFRFLFDSAGRRKASLKKKTRKRERKTISIKKWAKDRNQNKERKKRNLCFPSSSRYI